MVKITEDDEDTTAFLAKGILYGHVNVLERDPGRACRWGVGGRDRSRGHTWATLNEDHGEAILVMILGWKELGIMFLPRFCSRP